MQVKEENITDQRYRTKIKNDFIPSFKNDFNKNVKKMNITEKLPL